MKTKNILFVALIVLLAGMVSCKKDHDIPTGKVFNGGSGGGSTTDSLTISVTANPSEGGTVSGGGKYLKGKTCVVAASANEGYVFSNWMENGIQVSTSVSYSFTVDVDRTLVANFSVSTGNNFTITAVAGPEYGGVISGSGTYQQGQNCTVTAAANNGYAFVNWTENGNVVSTNASYTFTVNGNRTLQAKFSYIGGGSQEYVDLGLPSGLLWATCNVGANAPEEYGDYFAWGETQPKDTYGWSNYQHSNGGTSWQNPNLIKYCNNSSYGYNGFTDNLTILLPDDDAATANWGSDWRMPTSEEWQELYVNTTHTWTTHNGVNGKLYTASNGNSLFLPAAGYRWSGELSDAGSNGFYWSSSLGTDYPSRAWHFRFGSDGYFMDDVNRYYGLSVRAVRSSSQNYTIITSANPTNGGTVSGGGPYQQGQTCTLTATNNTGFTFDHWTRNGTTISGGATISFTVTFDATYVAYFISNTGGHAYVDLGLPSGLLWATCNVGADNPEDYGDYFAWGETQPKNDYSWGTYQYCMGSEYTLTKYCDNSNYGYNGFTDNLTTLLSSDDAATAQWGSGWRMPTEAECQELLNNTTHIWTTQNGVTGRLFTATNGNSLFLPAAGARDGTSLYYAGANGDYWSSSLSTGYPYYAWGLYFGSGNCNLSNGGRACGFTVRPVRSSRQN